MAVLAAAFLGLVFDGFELGLMPVASLSVTKSLMGEAFTPAAGGDWFARYTAALMLGAAIGGVWPNGVALVAGDDAAKLFADGIILPLPLSRPRNPDRS